MCAGALGDEMKDTLGTRFLPFYPEGFHMSDSVPSLDSINLYWENTLINACGRNEVSNTSKCECNGSVGVGLLGGLREGGKREREVGGGVGASG